MSSCDLTGSFPVYTQGVQPHHMLDRLGFWVFFFASLIVLILSALRRHRYKGVQPNHLLDKLFLLVLLFLFCPHSDITHTHTHTLTCIHAHKHPYTHTHANTNTHLRTKAAQKQHNKSNDFAESGMFCTPGDMLYLQKTDQRILTLDMDNKL